jgi:PAS domain S-box-containing protein
MQLSILNLLRSELRQIEFIAAEIAEAVIILDRSQEIVWANGAALAMHGANDAAALGGTLDDYHANFQVRFKPLHKLAGQKQAADAAARDSLIEISPLTEGHAACLVRVRKLPVPDESGAPRYTVLIMTEVAGDDELPSTVVSSIRDMAGAAAVLRRGDAAIIDANSAFQRLTRMDLSVGPDLAAANDLISNSESAAFIRRCMIDAQPFPFTLTHIANEAGLPQPALIAGQPAVYNGESCMVLTIVDWEGLQPAVAAAAVHDPDSLRAFAIGLCAAAPSMANVLDNQMRIVAASTPWLDWLGYSTEVATGRKITDFMTASCAARFTDTIWATLASNGSVHNYAVQFLNARGEPMDSLISVNSTPGEGGSVMCAVVAAIDAREQRRSEDRFNKLMALSPTPLLIRRMDDNRIMDVNDAFMTATGYCAEAIIGHGADELWHYAVKSDRSSVDQDLRAGKRVQKIDVKLKTIHGDVAEALLSGERIEIFGQSCALLSFLDVTDRRRGEAELFEAIETVMEDTTWFTRSVIEKVATLRRPGRPGGPAPEISDLTPREREVLGLISHGMTDTDIAEKLGLTRCTVRNHVATLYSKIGVHSRGSAIVWARERGVNLTWPVKATPGFMREPSVRRKDAAVVKLARP